MAISNETFNLYRPSPSTVWLLTLPLRWYFKPVFLGMDNITAGRPYLFVGNHTIYGVLDGPLYVAEIYRQKGLYLRGLGDYYHFRVPVWGELLNALGAVEGTRENCRKLMADNESILVFPGGGREVCKRRGEAYKLLWKNRFGFVKLAVEFGYDILPFASVGPENAYSILLDADHFLNSWMAKLLDRKGLLKSLLRNGEAVPPIARGIAFTPIPRPEKFYFSFGKPISTKKYTGKQDAPAVLKRIRSRVARSINDQFGKLLLYREQDTDKGLLRRMLTRL